MASTQFSELVDRVNAAIGASDWVELQQVAELLRSHFPNAEDGYRFGVIACSGTGNYTELDSILVDAMRAFPQNLNYAYNYALSAEQRGELAEARLRWESVTHAYGESQVPFEWYNEFMARHRSVFSAPSENDHSVDRTASLAIQCMYTALKMTVQGDYQSLPAYWEKLNHADINPALVKIGCAILKYCELNEPKLVKDIVAVMLQQPFHPEVDASPALVTTILDLKLRGIDQKAAILVSALRECILDNPNISDTAGICALCFEIPLPPNRALDLVSRMLLAHGYWRFSHIFGNNNHIHVTHRSVNYLVAPLVDLLIATNAIINLSHAQIYRIACLLYCIDRHALIRLAQHVSSWHHLPDVYQNSVFGVDLLTAVCSLAPKYRAKQRQNTTVAPVRKLRIAVCISGQLRGYREAIKSWELLGLQGHVVDTYVHTWKVIGRRFPDALQAHRVLSGEFLSVYKKVYFHLSRAGIEKNYPHFSRLFDGHEQVTFNDLRETYQTEKIVIQDDRDPDFQHLNTVMKMHYKIESCFDMIEQSGVKYDLILRIRPDLLVEGSEPLDLVELCQHSNDERLIYANFQPIISSGIVSWQMGQCIPLMIGDLFAIGTPEVMKRYGSAYSDNIRAIQSGTFGIPKGFAAHTSLALLLMRHGVFVDTVPSVRMVDFCEPNAIPPDVLKNALMLDIASRMPTDFDSELLGSI